MADFIPQGIDVIAPPATPESGFVPPGQDADEETIKFSAQSPEELAKAEFDPVGYLNQNKDKLTPEQVDKLAETLKHVAARPFTDMHVGTVIGAGVEAAKTFAKGLFRAGKIKAKTTLEASPLGAVARAVQGATGVDIPGIRTEAERAGEAANAAAATEADVMNDVGLLRTASRNQIRAQQGQINKAASALTGIPEEKFPVPQGDILRPFTAYSPVDWKQQLFDDAAQREQNQKIIEGEGPVTSLLGLSKEDLAKQGIQWDQKAVEELMPVTEPLNFVVLPGVSEAGSLVQVVSKGRVLGVLPKAATIAAGTGKAVETVGDLLTNLAKGAGARTVARVVGIGEVVGGHATAGLGAAIVPSVVRRGAALLSKAGPLAEKVALPVIDAADAAVKGAVGGTIAATPFAAASETPEQAGTMLAVGAGLGGLMEGGQAAAGHAARIGAANAQSAGESSLSRAASEIAKPGVVTDVPRYGLDPTLDAAHARTLEALDKVSPEAANSVRLMRRIAEQNGLGEVYNVDNATFVEKAKSRLPEGAKATDPNLPYGLTVREKMPDGGFRDKVLFRTDPNDPHVVFHETGHLVDYSLTSEQRAKLDAVRDKAYPVGSKQFEQFKEQYQKRLGKGISDAAVQREINAELFASVLKGYTLDGVNLSLRKQILHGAARFLEGLGVFSPNVAAPSTGTALLQPKGLSPRALKVAGEIVSGLQTPEPVSPPVISKTPPPVPATPPPLPVAPEAPIPVAPESPIVLHPLQQKGVANTSEIPKGLLEIPVHRRSDLASREVGAEPGLMTKPPEELGKVEDVKGRITVVPETPAEEPSVSVPTKPTVPKEDFGPNPENQRVLTAVEADPNISPESKQAARQLADLPPGVAVVEYTHESAEGIEGTSKNRFGRRLQHEEKRAGGPTEPVQKIGIFTEMTLSSKNKIPQAGFYTPEHVHINAQNISEKVSKWLEENPASPDRDAIAASIPFDHNEAGVFTPQGTAQFRASLEAYWNNHANGYTGGGAEPVIPPGYTGFIPPKNPAYKPTFLPPDVVDFLNAAMGAAPPRTARITPAPGGKVVEPTNVRARKLAEANQKPALRPGNLPAGKDIPKFDLPGSPEIAEFNPLRQLWERNGIEIRRAMEVMERVNIADISGVTPRPEVDLKAPSADLISAGFLPARERTPVKIIGPDGTVHEGTFDGFQDFTALGRGHAAQITTATDIPGTPFIKDGTTYQYVLEKAGFKVVGAPESPTPAQLERSGTYQLPARKTMQERLAELEAAEGRADFMPSMEQYLKRLKSGYYDVPVKVKAKSKSKDLPLTSWILPSGEVVRAEKGVDIQNAGDFHGGYLAQNAKELTRRFGYAPDKVGEREGALKAGLVRVRYEGSNGTLHIEAAKAKWNNTVKNALEDLVDAQPGKIDRIEVSLLDKDGFRAQYDVANVFGIPDREKSMNIPLTGRGGDFLPVRRRGEPEETPRVALTDKSWITREGKVIPVVGMAADHATKAGEILGKPLKASPGFEEWSQVLNEFKALGNLRAQVVGDSLHISGAAAKFTDLSRSQQNIVRKMAEDHNLELSYNGRYIDEAGFLPAKIELKPEDKPVLPEEAGIRNYWMSPKGELYPAGDHRAWAAARVTGQEGTRMASGRLSLEAGAEQALKDAGWLRLSRERENGGHQAIFIDGRSDKEAQKAALSLMRANNPDAEFIDTRGIRGNFLPAKQEDIAKTGLAFKDFFSKVTKGEFGKSEKPFQPVLPLQGAEPFLAELANHSGNFDDHISKSIPTFKETQVKTGDAIVKALPEGGAVLDIAASEGSWAKTITALSDGKIKTVALDPNPEMAKFFRDKSKVKGSDYVEEAFAEGFTDNGKEVPAYDPEQRFDVAHESMGFQFISNERAKQIAEAKRLLKPDGVLLVEEKLRNEDWAANETKKDTDWKDKYFTKSELAAKDKVVGFQQSKQEAKAVGMVDNMVSVGDLERVLKENFDHVVQYWDSGNFKGFAASDSPELLGKIVDGIGDLNSEFSTAETPRVVGQDKGLGDFEVQLKDQGNFLPGSGHGPREYNPSKNKLSESEGLKLWEKIQGIKNGLRTSRPDSPYARDLKKELGPLEEKYRAHRDEVEAELAPNEGKQQGPTTSKGRTITKEDFDLDTYRLMPKGDVPIQPAWILPDGDAILVPIGAIYHDNAVEGFLEFGLKPSDVAQNHGALRFATYDSPRQLADYGNGHLGISVSKKPTEAQMALVRKALNEKSGLRDEDPVWGGGISIDIQDETGRVIRGQNFEYFDKNKALRYLATLGEGEANFLPTIYHKGEELVRPKQQSLFGGDVEEYSRNAIGQMTREELKSHFPEALVSTGVKHSDLLGSPRYKQAENHEAAVNDFADNLAEQYRAVADSPEVKAGSRWYSEFTPALKKYFGEDAQLFAELLAATSPQTAPDQNFADAIEAYRLFKAGAYDKKVAKFNDGFDRLSDGRMQKSYERARREAKDKAGWPESPTPEGLMARWIEAHDLIPTKEARANDKGEVVAPKFHQNSRAVLFVLARKWLNENRGPKTSQFVQNLMGQDFGATIDLWADRTLREIGYKDFQERWRILPENKAGVSDEDFAFGQEVFKAAAKKLKIKPSDLQGAMWFIEKRKWADNGWGPLDFGDFRRELNKVTGRYPTKEALVAPRTKARLGKQIELDVTPKKAQVKQ